MATIFSDGFESGDFSAWTGTRNGASGSVPSIVTAPVHHGGYGSKVSLTGTGVGYSQVYKTLASAQTTLYHQEYVYVSALPAAGQYVVCTFQAKNDFTLFCGASIGVSGGVPIWFLKYRDNAGEHDALSTVTPVINMPCCVTTLFKQGNGTGECSLWVNGTKIVEVTGLTNTLIAPQTLVSGLGSDAGYAVNVYYDCVVASDGYIGTEVSNRLLMGVGLGCVSSP